MVAVGLAIDTSLALTTAALGVAARHALHPSYRRSRTPGILAFVASLLCFIYVVQLTTIIHVRAPAAASGGQATVPWLCYVPFVGFAKTRSLYYTWVPTASNRLWVAQAGFMAQVVVLLAAAFLLYLPHPGHALLMTALGYLIYIFVYPHVHTRWTNEFAEWA